MRRFNFQRASEAAEAVNEAGRMPLSVELPQTAAPAQFLAGGTTLLDLMKLDVMRPERLIEINALSGRHGEIRPSDTALRLGGLARMSDVAAHPMVRRDYPAIAQSLEFAASPQLRNMATLAGNVLQRTRCPYFRDVTWNACNKRNPGSGCAAMDGVNRRHAILGVSDHCIAAYPGDFAQALIALDATVEILGSSGAMTIPFAELHREPGSTPHIETRLAPGALITAFTVPAGPWTRRSLYLKIRDRESYEFALASAAVALDLQKGVVKTVRIALGASPPGLGARMRRKICSSVMLSTGRGHTRPRALLLPRLTRAKATASKSSSAGARSSVRCCRLRPWRLRWRNKR